MDIEGRDGEFFFDQYVKEEDVFDLLQMDGILYSDCQDVVFVRLDDILSIRADIMKPKFEEFIESITSNINYLYMINRELLTYQMCYFSIPILTRISTHK